MGEEGSDVCLSSYKRVQESVEACVRRCLEKHYDNVRIDEIHYARVEAPAPARAPPELPATRVRTAPERLTTPIAPKRKRKAPGSAVAKALAEEPSAKKARPAAASATRVRTAPERYDDVTPIAPQRKRKAPGSAVAKALAARPIKWTAAEERYSALVAARFCDGTLPGLLGRKLLKTVLGNVLSCSEDRIRDKYRGTDLLRDAGRFVRRGELAADGVEALGVARAAFLADRELGKAVARPFPCVLKDMIDNTPDDVVAWSDDGRVVLVRDADVLCKDLFPECFQRFHPESRGESLHRRLADWQFSHARVQRPAAPDGRLATNPRGGGLLAYQHPKFVRDADEAALREMRSSTTRNTKTMLPVRALVEALDDELFDQAIHQGGASGVITLESLANVDIEDVPRAKWITGVDDNDALAVALLARWRDRAREFAAKSRGAIVPREYLPAKANFGPGMFLANKEELYGTPVGVLSRATIGDKDLDDLLSPARRITTTPEDRSGKRGKTMMSASGRCDQLAHAHFEQARKTEEAFAKLEAYRQRTA